VGPPRNPVTGAWQTLSQCGVVDRAGNYRVGADLVSEGDCINVQTSYATLDCGGHSIRGTGFGGVGIAVRKYGLLGNTSPTYVEIRNCKLSNFRFGILAEGSNHLVIQGNDSSNNYDDTDPKSRYGDFLGMTEGGGIRANNIADSSIFGNTTSHQAIGIDVRYSSRVTIRNNTASDNSAWGINLYATQNSEVSTNATADNVRRCTWGAGDIGFGCDAGGIVVQGGSNNNTISNNQVTGRNGNGIFIKAHNMPCGNNNSIISNTISSVMYNAVELGFCSGNKINGNTIKEGLDGIWLGFAHDTEIRNNTITNMRNHGIISSNSWSNVVNGNQIVNSNEGLYFYGEIYDPKAFSWLPAGDYRSHDNCLCANTLLNNFTTGVRLKDTTNNQVTNNVFQGNGRTVIVMGNTSGTNLQGNIMSWIPLPSSPLLALDTGLLSRELSPRR
jgi:parallel beta-helix repeat protein